MATTTDELSKFSNESLHSYSFTNAAHEKSFVEGRRSIFYRSIDFMKQKIKGWQVPISNVFPASASTTPTDAFSSSSIGAYPSPTPSSVSVFAEPGLDGSGHLSKPKLKRTMTDIPTTKSSGNKIDGSHSSSGMSGSGGKDHSQQRPARPLSVATISTMGNYMFGYHGSELTTMTILDLVASPYKEKLETLLHHQSQDGSLDSKDEHVLLCGKV
ncbi:hypothetical protein BGW38_006315, partial [Lunasporangiospora selenospora]